MSCCPGAASVEDMAVETAGIPKPGGTVNPGTTEAPPEDGGGGELAAKTLPILAGGEKGDTVSEPSPVTRASTADRKPL